MEIKYQRHLVLCVQTQIHEKDKCSGLFYQFGIAWGTSSHAGFGQSVFCKHNVQFKNQMKGKGQIKGDKMLQVQPRKVDLALSNIAKTTYQYKFI